MTASRPHDYSGRRRDALVCTATKDEHDAIVAMRGRPYTDEGMRPRSLDIQTPEATSIVDTFLAQHRRASQ